MTEAPDFHSVECPHCGAQPGESCVEGGELRPFAVHVDRTEAYWAQEDADAGS